MNCPVCLKDSTAEILETHTDYINNQEYKMRLCEKCGAVFADPAAAPAAEWYIKFSPARREKFNLRLNWGHRKYFEEDLSFTGKILDVGCGCGNFLYKAQESGYQATGIDFDGRAVAFANGIGLKDVSCISFEEFRNKRANEKFDSVVLFEFLEHVPDPNRFVAQIKDMLVQNGCLAVMVPNADRPLCFRFQQYDYPPQHFTRWTLKTLKTFLGMLGFNIITAKKGSMPYFYVNDNIFYFLVSKILSVIKRCFYSGISYKDASSLPLDTIGEKSGKKVSIGSVPSRYRRILVKILKFFYSIIFFPINFFIWMWFKIIGKSCYIYVFARKIQ
ncbi:MAG: Ubiquinone biosynthesis O-methyltransferase [Elusimicrobia bacterium ADurb.Bin231]|nr:MAG: Ubiquinone biosynthesis O-methyltransferase [Elusimicrobia bacterium ADurb.Bin231]